MLNSKQVEALFEKEAIFIEQDVVPAYRVKELFGEQAFGLVTSRDYAGKYYNYYGGSADNDLVMIITRSGFMVAASRANALKLSKSQMEAHRG